MGAGSRFTVRGCGQCPFAMRIEASDDTVRLGCKASDLKEVPPANSAYPHVSGGAPSVEDAYARVPGWCPLRREAISVCLEGPPE